MNKNALCFWTTVYILYFIDISISAPPLYCHQQINTSDCGGAPTPVFSFYKPGSRCEIEIWRGCATLNKFDDEYQCVHTCIFKFFKSSEELSVELLMHNESNCDKDLNTTKCTDKIIPVYTYKSRNNKCVEVNWKGCSTDNKFPDEKSCIANCMPDANKGNLKKKLSHLVPKDANNINSVLDQILKEDLEELKLTTEFFPEESTVKNASITDLANINEKDHTKTKVDDSTIDVVDENSSEMTIIPTTLPTTLISSTETEPSSTLTTIPTTTRAIMTEATTQLTEVPTTTTTSAPTTTTTSAPTTTITSEPTTTTTKAPTTITTTAPTTTTTPAPTTTTTKAPTTTTTSAPTTTITSEPTTTTTTAPTTTTTTAPTTTTTPAPTTTTTTAPTTTTTSAPTTTITSEPTTTTTTAPTTTTTSAPTTTTTPTTTTPTTTTIPPSGTVEEVVVPSVDDYDDD